MMIALVARAKNLSRNLIYHIGSSLKNPFKMSDLQDVMYSYSQKNPWIGKNGKPVVVPKKLTLYSTSMDEFDQNKVYVHKTQVNYNLSCFIALI